MEMIAEHEKDRYEVPDHRQSQARDKLHKMEVWRHTKVKYSASYVADDKDTENYGDSFHTLIQVMTSLPDSPERIKKRNNCQ